MLKRVPLLLLILVAVIPSGNSHGPVTTKITFNREVIRILARRCLACHSPGRIRQELPLTTYAEARPWAKAIKEEILNRRMAPFQAVKGFGLFHENYALSQYEQDQLISWIDGGAPKGEQKDYPGDEISRIRPSVRTGRARSTEPEEWPAGPPNLILEPRTDSVIAPGKAIVKRCFAIPARNRKEQWIGMIDFEPGQAGLVFNASFHIADAGIAGGCDKHRKSLKGRLEPLGEWVPGQPPIRWPAGMAKRLRPNSIIVLNITYQGSDRPVTDRSRLGIYFDSLFTSRTDGREIEQIVISSPARPGNMRNEQSAIRLSRTLAEDREIVGIRPLIFPHGSSLEARLTRPDGSVEVLVLVRDYHFDWQPTYFFRIPRPAPQGSIIDVIAYGKPHPEAEPVHPLCQLVTARAIR